MSGQTGGGHTFLVLKYTHSRSESRSEITKVFLLVEM